MYTFDEQTVSDLHKDARGWRPREYFWERWEAASPAEKQEIWDGLIGELESELAREKAQQERAIASYEATLAELMQYGAKDRETAKRWYLDSLNLSDMDVRYGADYVCYELGFPYSMKGEFEAYIAEKRAGLED